jgi:hypothetical protein
MTQYETPEKAPQAVSRLGLYLPTGLLFVLALGWSGFWLFASKQADQALSSWLTAERAGGRTWECLGKTIIGYPFRIELHCDAVKLSGASIEAHLGQLHAATQIYSPKLVLADVGGPLQINSGGIANTFSWGNMRVSLRFGHGLERLSMSVSDFRADEGTTSTAISVKNLEFHLRTDTEKSVEEKAADIVLNMSEIRSAALDMLVSNQDPTAVTFTGNMTQIWGLRAGSWQSVLENWRAQNGQLFLENGRIAKGGFVMEGKGTLSLDAAHRVQGNLAAGVRGASPIIARFVSGNAAQLAGALLERKDGTMVQLPLRLQDGRISFGPLRTGPVLTPLY